MVVAPGRGLQNAAKSRTPRSGCTAASIAATSSGRRFHRTQARRSGSRCAASSATRYVYARCRAEKRASNPAGAGAARWTTTSLGSTPPSRATSASPGERSERPGNASHWSRVRSTCATCPRACTPASVRPATVRRGAGPAGASRDRPRPRPGPSAAPAGGPTRRSPSPGRRGPGGPARRRRAARAAPCRRQGRTRGRRGPGRRSREFTVVARPCGTRVVVPTLRPMTGDRADVRTLAVDCGGGGIKANVLDASGTAHAAAVRVPTPYPLPPSCWSRRSRRSRRRCRPPTGPPSGCPA